MMAASSEPQTNDTFFSRKVVSGVPWVVSSRLVLFFVYLAIPILIVRSLGAEKYGLFSLCRFVAEVCIVTCGLGLNTAIIRFIPELSVNQNRAGMIRLLLRVGVMQGGMVLGAGVVVYLLRPWLDMWFHVQFQHFLFFAMLLCAARLLKNLVDDTYTALFRVYLVGIISISQALLSFLFAFFVLPRFAEVHVALLTQSVPILLTSLIGLVLLLGHIRGLKWRSPPLGIGKRRVLGISIPSMMNSFASMILSQYSELFFIGLLSTPAMVGVYEVGAGFPFMVITFLPLALQSLLTSGFAEAHAQNPDSIGPLVRSFYKALILVILPMSAFGVFFAPRGIELLYGVEMKASGPIASCFFVIHTMGLISTPLSMAIVAKEKLLHMQPLMILQIAVNLALDYVLIKNFGMYGGIGAILGTFLLTIPFRLYVVARVVGGIYFPLGFFLKFLLTVFLWAAVLYPLSWHINLFGLAGVCAGYGIGYLIMIRMLRLVRKEDVASLRALGFSKLNRILDLLVVERSYA